MGRLEEQDTLSYIWGRLHQSCACKPLGIILFKKKTNKNHKTTTKPQQQQKSKNKQTHKKITKKLTKKKPPKNPPKQPTAKQANKKQQQKPQQQQNPKPLWFKFLSGLGHQNYWKWGSACSVSQKPLSLW